MPDIFNTKAVEVRGAIEADGARIIFSAGGSASPSLVGGVGLITQSFQVGYAQMVNLLYEIGSNAVFIVKGRSRGQLTLSRVLGPRPIQIEFYKKYGDACNAASNHIALSLTAGCRGAGELAGVPEGGYDIGLSAVVLTNITIGTNVNDMIVNEQLSGLFVAMDLNAVGAAA